MDSRVANLGGIDNLKIKGGDFVWLLYFIIIFTFNAAYDNVQATSTILLFFAVVAMYFMKRRKLAVKKITRKGVFFWYCFFFLYVGMSYFFSSPLGIKSGNEITSLIQILVLLLCIDWYIDSYRDAIALVKCFCYAALFFSLYVFFTSPVSSYGSLEFGSKTGMQRNSIAYILIFAAIINIYFHKTSKYRRYLVMAVTSFIVSLLTGSRKIIFGYVLAVMIWILSQKDLRKSVRYMMLLLLGVIIVVPVLYQFSFFQDVFGERLLAVLDDSIDDSSIDYRNMAKQLAIQLFYQSPVFGNGWNAVKVNFPVYYAGVTYNSVAIYAHNNYLELLADFGLIGTFLYYWKILRNEIFCIKHIKKSSFAVMLAICFSVVLLLEWGQVTYCYIYMVLIPALLFKLLEYKEKQLY